MRQPQFSWDLILRQMDEWYQSVLGVELLSIERQALDQYLPYYYGRRLLQVCGPGDAFLVERSPICQNVRLSPGFSSRFRGACVQADLASWPFESGSFNVVLMPHVLELVEDLNPVLQAAYNSLAPEGYLLILGFNPYSLWGVNRLLGGSGRFSWVKRFYSASSVRRCLLHQGFMIEHSNTLFFRPPIDKMVWLERLFVLEPIGKLLYPNWGAVYLTIAKKTIKPLIPLLDHQKIPLVRCKPLLQGAES